MRKLFTKNKDKGASAVEYGLMIALIAAVILTVVAVLGGGVRDSFQSVCNKITNTTCAK